MKRFIPLWIAFTLMSTWATADTIVLKNGRRIDTPGAWVENDRVRYFSDGVVAKDLPKSEVERIETAEETTELEAPQSPSSPTVVDLKERLAQDVPPKNPIEAAGNATVTIRSAVGSGSGFFVTPDGYLLTNRHVIEGDERKLGAMEAQLAEAERQLNLADRALKAERRKIEQFENQIRTDKRYNNPHNIEVLQDAKTRYAANHEAYKLRKTAIKEGNSELAEMKSRLLFQQTVTIVLVDGVELTATIEQISDTLDLALLHLSGHRTPYIQPGRVDTVAQGDPLFAIGNPLNFSHSVSAGVFSGHQRDMLMTSAPINAGNSGGPLVNQQGRVVGINTMKMVGEGVEGIGFAIPIQAALDVFGNVLKAGASPR